jgi:phospholipid/cholesterol/gamma-HCH transport system ATP-binding protein
MATPLIELKGISHSFAEHKVLEEAHLTVYEGESLVIIGPSGTGKSTILRVIAGLMAPDAGEVYVRGLPYRGAVEDPHGAVRMGMVFQQAALFDSLTVCENVGFFLYQHSRLSRKKIRELVDQKLEMVGLTGTADLYPSALSGGMRKRVSFARAILNNPEDPADQPLALLYDEPTAGLDPIASTMVEDLIRQLQYAPGGCPTCVVVTHQNSTIQRTADRVILLYQGKICWEGTVSALNHTDNPFIRQFISGQIQGPIEVAGH